MSADSIDQPDDIRHDVGEKQQLEPGGISPDVALEQRASAQLHEETDQPIPSVAVIGALDDTKPYDQTPGYETVRDWLHEKEGESYSWNETKNYQWIDDVAARDLDVLLVSDPADEWMMKDATLDDSIFATEQELLATENGYVDTFQNGQSWMLPPDNGTDSTAEKHDSNDDIGNVDENLASVPNDGQESPDWDAQWEEVDRWNAEQISAIPHEDSPVTYEERGNLENEFFEKLANAEGHDGKHIGEFPVDRLDPPTSLPDYLRDVVENPTIERDDLYPKKAYYRDDEYKLPDGRRGFRDGLGGTIVVLDPNHEADGGTYYRGDEQAFWDVW